MDNYIFTVEETNYICCCFEGDKPARKHTLINMVEEQTSLETNLELKKLGHTALSKLYLLTDYDYQCLPLVLTE